MSSTPTRPPGSDLAVPLLSQPSTRRERQQAEILSETYEGRVNHALGLAFEHLDEFGDDDLVVGALSIAVADRQDRALSSEFHALIERAASKLESR